MIHSNKTLCIGGGASASVFTAGMLDELDRVGKIKDFEYIIGASSGAFSACFVVGEAVSNGAEAYWKMLPDFNRDPQYISWWHLMRLRPIMNVR